MADDTRLPLGTLDGDTYRSDDNAGVKTQVVKIELGLDGTFSGFVADTNPLPVKAFGTVAHDAPHGTTAPLLIGGYARSSAPTNVANSDAVRGWYGLNGAGAVFLTDAAGSLLDLSAGTMPVSGVVTVAGTVDTELPAAGVLADNMGNPTTPLVGSCLMGFDGATWDRVPNGNGVAAAAVRVTVASDSTGTIAATQATASNLNAEVQGDAATDAPVTGNPVLAGGRASTATPAAMSADGDAVPCWLDRSGATVATGYVAQDAAVAGNPLLAGFRASTATPGAVSADGDSVFGRALRTGEQCVNLRDGTGAETGVAAVPLRTDPIGTTAQPVSQATASNLNAEVQGDAASDAPVTGNPLLSGGRASTATPAAMSADGDAVARWLDRSGATVATGYVATDAPVAGNPVGVGGRASTATPAAMSADGDAVPLWLDRSGATIAVGTAASDAAVVGNPLRSGGRASTATPAAMSADGDAVARWLDRSGATVVAGYAAADAAVAGNPVYVGARASIVAPTLVSADGDVVPPWADRRGALIACPKPIDWGSLGIYSVTATNGTTAMAAGLAAASPILAFRWGDATRFALIKRINLSAVTTATAFVAGLTQFSLFMARAFTASDTAGAALTMTTNNAKRRTTMGTSLVTEIRRSQTAAMTAGTRTLDANPFGSAFGQQGTTANAMIVPTSTDLFRHRPDEYPLVLAQNEGFVIQATVPGTGTWFFAVDIEWAEVTAY